MFSANTRPPWTSTTPRFTITSISVPSWSSGALPILSRPGSNEMWPATPPSRRPSSRPRNSGRSRSSGTRSWSSTNSPPTITSRSIETPSPPRPPPPPPSFGMSSPPGPSGGEGKAWMRSRMPSRRTRESTMRLPRQGATLGRTRTESDLEERRRIGRDAAHAQAAELQLAGCEPEAEVLHGHRALEGARRASSRRGGRPTAARATARRARSLPARARRAAACAGGTPRLS